ncbi:MAG: PAS domain-containing protein [Gallionella sp.]
MNLVKYGNAAIDGNTFPASEQLERTHIASWHEPAALTLDERGMIRDCNKSGEKLFGYPRHDLIWQHVSKLLPQLSEVALVQQQRFNPLLNFLCRCGKLFQTENRQGKTFPSELSFVHLEHEGMRTLRVIVHPFGNAKS